MKTLLKNTLSIIPVFVLIGLGPRLTASPDDFQEATNFTLPLAAGGSFSLDNLNGAITITGWDRDEVMVEAVKQGGTQAELDAVKIKVESNGRRISIHTRYPSESAWKNSVNVIYTVKVPSRARRARIDNVNGAVNITGVRGDVAVSTVNGEAHISGSAGEIKLATVNGRISAKLDRLGRGQHASFNTVNGEIQLSLPPGADATVSADTLNGGISSDFPALVAKKEFPVGNHLQGTLGDGGAKLNLTS